MGFVQANLIGPVSNVLYTYILVYLLVAAGIYFTVRTRFVQVRYFGPAIATAGRNCRWSM